MKSADYPFLDRVRDILKEKGKKLQWLGTEIDKSDRWFYNITDFTRMELGVLNKISELLEFNFEVDYNRWLLEQGQKPLFIVGDVNSEYEVRSKRITINLQISASQENAENNTTKMLLAIRKEGAKYGFELR